MSKEILKLEKYKNSPPSGGKNIKIEHFIYFNIKIVKMEEPGIEPGFQNFPILTTFLLHYQTLHIFFQQYNNLFLLFLLKDVL